MKLFNNTYIVVITLFMTTMYSIQAQNIEAIEEVIYNYTDSSSKLPITFTLIEKEEGKDCFEINTENGSLHIKASSGVAFCRAFYDYSKRCGLGIYTWNGKRFDTSRGMPEIDSYSVKSPFKHHYYFNVVTYGYSMPYWDWNRWSDEIDWMALHGIDMPLALVANEAIMLRVWKKIGLTDKEINEYFVGPAHLPWMRMGNLSGIDGPLTQEWHETQIELQHQILKKMKSLDMKPICPAFAGFVPKALTRLYPNIRIVKTSWAGSFHNWMLDPKEKLFHTIGILFIQEWEKEFGKNDYYLADSFNEMEIPFPPVGTEERYELLSEYGEKLYHSIKDANKDATWVMQGWMFGYTRDIWEPKTLEALLKKVPDDKMLLLDLAEDYNHHFWNNGNNWDFYNGFYKKKWVYSVIPNMGGKTATTGFADFYMNGHIDALHAKKKGRLVGHGLAPEGIENNDVIYEIITDAGWSEKNINITEWYRGYTIARYGKSNKNLIKAWEGLCNSVYGTFTDHPRFNWQFRPGKVRKGSVYITEKFYQAVRDFLSCADDYKNSNLYEIDAIELSSLYVGGKMEELIQAVQDNLLVGNEDKAIEQFLLFSTLGKLMDLLLSNHPTHRLDYWLNFPQKSTKNIILQQQYIRNAKRIVSIWGPPIDDYSARIWEGLVGDYYMPRWYLWFDAQLNRKEIDFTLWEREWVEQQYLFKKTTKTDVFKLINSLLVMTETLQGNKSGIKDNERKIAVWNKNELTSDGELIYFISANDMKGLKGLRFVNSSLEDELIQVEKIEIVGDGQTLFFIDNKSHRNRQKTSNLFPIHIDNTIRLNNGCQLIIKIGEKHTKGSVLAVY